MIYRALPLFELLSDRDAAMPRCSNPTTSKLAEKFPSRGNSSAAPGHGGADATRLD